MITDKQKYAMVNQFRAHSLSVIRKNQKSFLPVFNTGKIFCCDKYRYMDKWHSYAYSADEPEKSFTILYVEHMPYRSLYKRVGNAAKSFTSSIDKMIFDNELVPFLLFINNRFVPWGKIDIVYDYGETFLKIHGPEYYKDLISDIKMVILPYNISFLYGSEPDYSFNSNFEALRSYINNNAVIKGQDIFITLPDTSVDYTYEHNTYNIGFWLLNQNKLKRLGVLSQERIDKLRQIDVNKIVNKDGHDEYMQTTVNIFDRDSYDNVELERLCNICPDNVLLKFNDNGELSDDGTNIIYLIDKSEVYYERTDVDGNSYIGRVKDGRLYIQDDVLGAEVQNELAHVHLNNSDEYVNGKDILFNENFLVFKNGCLCTDYKFDLQMYNNFKVYDIDKSTDYTADGKPYHQIQNNHMTILVFMGNCDHLITHIDQFPNKMYIKKRLTESFFLDKDITGYRDMISEPLDFDVYDAKLYDQNVSDSMNEVLDYNPLLLEPLYTKNVESKYYKGNELNEKIITVKKYKYKYLKENGKDVMKRVLINTRGIEIPRMRFDEDHETYPLIFINGELVYNYDEMKVYANKLSLPIQSDFDPTDEIEIMYITGINNNIINIDSYIDEDHCDPIPKDELRLFSTDVDGMLQYPEYKYDYDRISFPIYDRIYKTVSIDDNALGKKLQTRLGYVEYTGISVSDDFIGKKVTAVSSRRFVYQRLKIDRKTYKVLLDKKFKYCDNQKQYWLFINGRVVDKKNYLITIPKLTRPFDRMYIYSTKFFKPTDRVDLFYLPYELMDLNADKSVQLQENGYIEYKRLNLKYPLDPELYAIFINGKKIPKNNMIRVSTDTIRITKDTMSTNDLCIYPIVKDNMAEVSEYISSDRISKYETLINYIKKNLGYNELDKLFNEHTKMSNFEESMNADVARIAIINEIVRDFWVSNGYDYNKGPFVYDYEKDDFFIKDQNGNNIIPALNATPNINIMKYDLHYLYFVLVNNGKEYSGDVYLENGLSIENPTFKWAYNDNYNTEEIEHQRLNNVDIPIKDDYEYDYQPKLLINKDSKLKEFKLEASNGFNTCEAYININFCSPIYYGLVNKSLVDGTNKDIYSKNPKEIIKALNKVIQHTRELTLNNYVINNYNRFVFAVPRNYAYNDSGALAITFYLPDINSAEVIKANRNDKITPIFTDGITEAGTTTESDVNSRELGEFKMQKFKDNVMYINEYGYEEEYMIFISNGYFTRLYDNIGFNIKVK